MKMGFLKKMVQILNKQQYRDLIGWNSTATTIEIKNQKQFEKEVLPLYFRHGRMISFVRQLNLYGFKKVRGTVNESYTHETLVKTQGILGIKEIQTNRKIKNKEHHQILDPLSQAGQNQRRSSENKSQLTLKQQPQYFFGNKNIPQNRHYFPLISTVSQTSSINPFCFFAYSPLCFSFPEGWN